MFLVSGNGTVSNVSAIRCKSKFSESIVNLNLANGGLNAYRWIHFVQYTHDSHTVMIWTWDPAESSMVPDNTGPNPHILIRGRQRGANPGAEPR